MRRKGLLVSLLGSLSLLLLAAAQLPHPHDHADVVLPGIQLPHQFDTMADDCQQQHQQEGITMAMVSSRDSRHTGAHDPNCGPSIAMQQPSTTMRIAMKHRYTHPAHHQDSPSQSLWHSLRRDSLRVQGMHLKAQNGTAAAPSPLFVEGKDTPPPYQSPPASTITVTPSPQTLPQSLQGAVESGARSGCGEYFMDVHIGTPPKPFSLIIDTGSDLVWTQCSPCQACYDQEGPIFSPNASSSYSRIGCGDAECGMVSAARDREQCRGKQDAHSCRYSYWYGDMSNTTGDLAMETFALNLGDGQPFNVEGVVFGCGHANEGLFKGAGGLLGLGKGPLSFPSQLRKRFGHKFSYCLVSRNSNASVNSVLIFGEDKGLLSHADLQYTGFVKNTTVETFYYLDVEKVTVGGEAIAIPKEAWAIDGQGQGGTIIDSGTTLTYFNAQAYRPIAKAFEEKLTYPRVASSMLDVCYDVSGLSSIEVPEFSIFFKDGAVFKPPVENYFIELESQPLTYCLAFLQSPGSSTSLSILGNFLQQNIHVLYDLEHSRLGFAPMVCSSV